MWGHQPNCVFWPLPQCKLIQHEWKWHLKLSLKNSTEMPEGTKTCSTYVWAGLLRCHWLIDAVHKFVHMLEVLRHLCGQNHINNGLAQCPVVISGEEKGVPACKPDRQSSVLPHPCPDCTAECCLGRAALEEWAISCFSGFLQLWIPYYLDFFGWLVLVCLVFVCSVIFT